MEEENPEAIMLFKINVNKMLCLKSESQTALQLLSLPTMRHSINVVDSQSRHNDTSYAESFSSPLCPVNQKENLSFHTFFTCQQMYGKRFKCLSDVELKRNRVELGTKHQILRHCFVVHWYMFPLKRGLFDECGWEKRILNDCSKWMGINVAEKQILCHSQEAETFQLSVISRKSLSRESFMWSFGSCLEAMERKCHNVKKNY